MKIIEYGIVGADSPEELVAQVQQNLGEGWQPFGSLVITERSLPRGTGIMGVQYAQAIVRYEEKDPTAFGPG